MANAQQLVEAIAERLKMNRWQIEALHTRPAFHVRMRNNTRWCEFEITRENQFDENPDAVVERIVRGVQGKMRSMDE